MERMDGCREVIKARESDLEREQNVVQQDLDALDARQDAIAGEIKDLTTDRQELAKDVEPKWLSRYERIFAHHKDFAIVGVAHGACGGCHMKLPPQAVNDAKKLMDMTVCNFCGRILYWKP